LGYIDINKVLRLQNLNEAKENRSDLEV